MSVFKDYSAYYDLLYKDKDYAGEAAYIHDLIQRNSPGARTVLNLGCGTGNHDFLLADHGYEMTGVDFSEEMIGLARRKAVDGRHNGLSFQVGDARTAELGKTFDVVISLFHVMSYQITNEDLTAAFRTAAKHLKKGGLFLFDCWYGPGVLTDPPVVRHRVLTNEALHIHRIAEPVMHLHENYVDVHYTILVNELKAKSAYEVQELHKMRYLFLPEMREFLEKTGFILTGHYRWMHFDKPVDNTWNIVLVAKKQS